MSVVMKILVFTLSKARLRMFNIKMKRKDNILIIAVDLNNEGKPSKGGKSILIASTQGDQPVEGTESVKIGLNVYKPIIEEPEEEE